MNLARANGVPGLPHPRGFGQPFGARVWSGAVLSIYIEITRDARPHFDYIRNMKPNLIADLMAALAAEPRVRAVQAMVLAGSKGVPAGDLAALCGVSPSTMSFHLSQLREAGLVESRREGRTLHYIANLIALEALGQNVTRGFCPAIATGGAPQDIATLPGGFSMTSNDVTPKNVLFLCTGNSARSQIAEAILNHEGQGRFRAYSAGSFPKDAVHPRALAVLKRDGYPVEGLRPKSWDEFAGPDAPHMDFVFTVCDDAAGETCPIWPGQPMTAHWGVPDPAAFEGSEAATAAVFNDAIRMLYNRIAIFVSLPLSSLDRLSLKKRVDAIGAMARDPAVTTTPDVPA